MAAKSKKPKFQPWNHEEFLADRHVRAMTYIQRWMYCFLLHESFYSDERPYLPDDDNVLWALAGCKSKAQWTENMVAVRAMFVSIIVKGKRLLQHKRVSADWKTYSEEQKAKSDAAKKTNEKRWGKGDKKAIAKQSLSDSSAIAREVKLNEAKLSEGNVIPVACLSEEQMAAEKRIRKLLAAAWQEIKKGNTLDIPAPHPAFKDRWAGIVDQCAADAIEGVFRLWAVEEGDGHDPKPLHAFIIAWPRFRDRDPNVVGKSGAPEESPEVLVLRAQSEKQALEEAQKLYGTGSPAPAPATGGGMEDYLAELNNAEKQN